MLLVVVVPLVRRTRPLRVPVVVRPRFVRGRVRCRCRVVWMSGLLLPVQVVGRVVRRTRGTCRSVVDTVAQIQMVRGRSVVPVI